MFSLRCIQAMLPEIAMPRTCGLGSVGDCRRETLLPEKHKPKDKSKSQKIAEIDLEAVTTTTTKTNDGSLIRTAAIWIGSQSVSGRIT